MILNRDAFNSVFNRRDSVPGENDQKVNPMLVYQMGSQASVCDPR